MITMVAETTSARWAGAATGLANAFWQLGVVVVPLAVGAACQWVGSFEAAFGTLAAGPAVAFVCMLLLHERPTSEE